MPMTVIVLKNVPPSLRGDLTRWMQEISTGVYVGNFNTKIRNLLWQRVTETAGTGEAVLCFASRNELGYDFKTFNTTRKVIDFDGLPLVFIPKDSTEDSNNNMHQGFSNASKMHMARKTTKKISSKPKDYVVIDLETTGLDSNECEIIEVGAVRYLSGEISYFQKLIIPSGNIPKKISEITGITKKLINAEGEICTKALKEFLTFIKDLPLIGYNVVFDINFLNEALRKEGMEQLNNKIYDLKKVIMKEKLFQSDYKLDTSLKSYGIYEKVPHRALEDAKLTFQLVQKVNKIC